MIFNREKRGPESELQAIALIRNDFDHDIAALPSSINVTVGFTDLCNRENPIQYWFQ